MRTNKMSQFVQRGIKNTPPPHTHVHMHIHTELENVEMNLLIDVKLVISIGQYSIAFHLEKLICIFMNKSYLHHSVFCNLQ